MKKNLLIFFAIFVTNVAFAIVYNQLPANNDKAIFKTNANFFVLKDSTIIEAKDFDYKSNWFKSDVITTDDGTKIKVKDIIAYQLNNEYYVRTKETDSKFAKCIANGDVKLFEGKASFNNSVGSNSSSTSVMLYFIQKDNLEIHNYDDNLIVKMMDDNKVLSSELNTFLKDYQKSGIWWFIGLLGYFTIVLAVIFFIAAYFGRERTDQTSLIGLVGGSVLLPLGILEIVQGRKKGKNKSWPLQKIKTYINQYNSKKN